MSRILSRSTPHFMSQPSSSLLLVCALALSNTTLAQDNSPPPSLSAAVTDSTRAMAGELMTQLGQRLKSSLSSEGPEGAVSVCKEASPSIAKSLSAQHGAQMTRVGTRVRNPQMGAPNAWQKDALAKFESRLALGEAPAGMEYWQVIENAQGQRELHYAKAIMVQAMCVTCHGTSADIPAPLAEKIRLEYPKDQATGYSVGKLRGAVVVTRPLP